MAGALASGALATSAALVATDPGTPPAAADSLQPFGSCAALRQWYVDHSAAGAAVPGSPTGTNVQ